MSSLPKPVLRGHLRRSGLRMLAGAIAFAIFGGTLYKVLVATPRQNAYNEFIRTYNPDKHLEEMVRYGLLQSAKVGEKK